MAGFLLPDDFDTQIDLSQNNPNRRIKMLAFA